MIILGVLSGSILAFLLLARYLPVYGELNEHAPETTTLGNAVPVGQSGD